MASYEWRACCQSREPEIRGTIKLPIFPIFTIVSRVAEGGCPPPAPTDPYVRNSRIRFLRQWGSLRATSSLSVCPACTWVRSSMPPPRFLQTVPSPDAPLPSAGSAGAPACPNFHGTIRALRLPVARPAALRFLRLAVPTGASASSLPRRGCSPQAWGHCSAPHLADLFRGRRPGLPCSWGTLVCLCPAL
jgi:hypothetical protein